MSFEIGDGYMVVNDSKFEYDENDPRTYQDQYDAWLLTRETTEGDLSTYRGGSGEQGGYAPAQRQQAPSTPRTVAAMRRRQLL